MDPWKEYAVWQDCRNQVRDWAALEGKSATMSEDLYRSLSGRLSAKQQALAALNVSTHIVAYAVEVWRLFRSG